MLGISRRDAHGAEEKLHSIVTRHYPHANDPNSPSFVHVHNYGLKSSFPVGQLLFHSKDTPDNTSLGQCVHPPFTASVQVAM